MDLVEARDREFDASVRHPWETARLDVVARLIDRHAPLGPGAIVMDIGCGDTFVVEQLASRHPGAVFYAIDTAFTPELIERFRHRLNNPRILPFASLDDIAPPPDRAASLVLLMDVIEHIQDDGGFLQALARRPYIRPETKFLVTVPAYQSLFCSHDTFLGHYRRYSNRTLAARLAASGFTVIDMGYFFFSLLPIRVLQVVKERVLGIKPERDTSGLVTWNGGAAKSAVLRQVLTADADLGMLLKKAGITLTGLSNYAICAKSA